MSENLEAYFEDILHLLGKGVSTDAKFSIEPKLEIFAEIGSLTAKVLYPDGSTLKIFLAVDFSSGFPDWTHYSFHYIDRDNQCRFRYDDPPHYLGLPRFPHHKHEGPSELVLPCSKPSVHQIRAEIVDFIRPC